MSKIVTGVGSPRTVGAAGGGRTYAFNGITTTPGQVIGVNPARQSISVHNPGTVIIYFAPMQIQNTGMDVTLTPSVSALGGCFAVYPGSTLVLEGEVQKAWQAFAASGTGNPLTIFDSNV